MTPGAHRLEAYAMLANGSRIAKLEGTTTIEVSE
jgi:hypothetical protein